MALSNDHIAPVKSLAPVLFTPLPYCHGFYPAAALAPSLSLEPKVLIHEVTKTDECLKSVLEASPEGEGKPSKDVEDQTSTNDSYIEHKLSPSKPISDALYPLLGDDYDVVRNPQYACESINEYRVPGEPTGSYTGGVAIVDLKEQKNALKNDLLGVCTEEETKLTTAEGMGQLADIDNNGNSSRSLQFSSITSIIIILSAFCYYPWSIFLSHADFSILE